MKVLEKQKMSKKTQKAENALKRKTWDEVNPVTRVVRDKTKYSRKVKHKQALCF